jgi:Rrf2 family transcriptional regulator, nitric oxide-sensitive transcriptional repressor
MKLTTFTDYSLRVLLYLGADPERRSTIAEVAKSFQISEAHLTKVVHTLGKLGWAATVRGKGGGIALAMPADEIVIGDVVRATEGAAVPAECFGQGACTIARVCRLRSVLRDAVDAFYDVLDRCTLADLLNDGGALAGVVFHPSAAEATMQGAL